MKFPEPMLPLDRTRVTQTDGHWDQGPTLERVSSLPAPAAEPRQAERKAAAPLVALTMELNTGNISAVTKRSTHCCPSTQGRVFKRRD